MIKGYLVGLLVLLTACQKQGERNCSESGAGPPDKIVAQYEGRKITLAELDAAF